MADFVYISWYANKLLVSLAFCFKALNSCFLSPLRLWLLVNMFVYLLDGFKWLTCMQMC